jgi:hypothetical protein
MCAAPVDQTGPIDGVVLDHVAHAVPRWQDAWHRYAAELGAEWSSGGLATGFAPGQIEFANRGRIELLMPNDVATNDFLDRFIANNGPGPHHLTFKVPNLAAALARMDNTAYDPIGIDFSDPEWMEAFIHPRQATGVVVQLAEAPAPWSSPAPDDYPTDRRRRRDGSGLTAPASLHWVTHAVAELASASSLFMDLLGGRVTAEGNRSDHRWMELSWGGPVGLRLVAPTAGPESPLALWLGARSGRIHHLELSAEEPERLVGAVPVESAPPGPDQPTRSTAWVIPPEENVGLRLVVRAS